MIIITKKDYNALVSFSIKELPNEACAIIAGRGSEVKKIYFMENIKKKPDDFLMSPEEQFKVIKEMRKKDFEMIGVFHSHPDSPARPSHKDIKMAFYAEAVYFILSLKNRTKPVLKGFKIVKGKPIEEKIKIKEEIKDGKKDY